MYRHYGPKGPLADLLPAVLNQPTLQHVHVFFHNRRRDLQLGLCLAVNVLL